jgi:purine-nucleoside phosphorylase
MLYDPKVTSALLKKVSSLRPTLAMVLGSGFQHALAHLTVEREIAYGQLPGFPTVGVTGHAGKLVLGTFNKTPVMVLKGRAHYYEGLEMDRLTFPVRVMADYGIKTILLTNAAGAVNKSYRAGDFMALDDHINLMGANPLRGPTFAGLPRFVDMSRVYERRLIDISKKAAKASKVKLHLGTYIAVSGPNYETPAEIRAFRHMGADAVGMSTVPEAIVARQCGMAVAGVSCITNVAGGDPKSRSLAHSEVLNVGEGRKKEMAVFLKTFTALYAGHK